MSEQPIVVFTDGASKGNPGPGGWGVIILTPDGHVTELGGGAPLTTNNKMELTGAIRAFEHLRATGGPVAIHTDSTYVIKGIREWVHGWKRRGWKTATGSDVLNRDLWERLDGLTSARGPRTIAWHYVRGHVGIPGNERVDRIADAFAMHTPVALYDGPLDGYAVAILDLPDNTGVPARSTSSSGASKTKSAASRTSASSMASRCAIPRGPSASGASRDVRAHCSRRRRARPIKTRSFAPGASSPRTCSSIKLRRDREPFYDAISCACANRHCQQDATRMKSRGFIGPSPVTT